MITDFGQTIFHGTYRHGDEEFRVGRSFPSHFRVVYEYQGSCTVNIITLLRSVIQIQQTRISFVWEQPLGAGGPRVSAITDMSETSNLNFETIVELLNFLLALRVV